LLLELAHRHALSFFVYHPKTGPTSVDSSLAVQLAKLRLLSGFESNCPIAEQNIPTADDPLSAPAGKEIGWVGYHFHLKIERSILGQRLLTAGGEYGETGETGRLRNVAGDQSMLNDLSDRKGRLSKS
jgi:hypothetical protein